MGRSDGCRRQLRRDDSQRLQIRLGQAGGQHAAPDAAPHPLDREALCAPADARSRRTPLYLLDRGTHGRPHGGCARGGRGAQHAARGLRRAETCGASGPHLLDARCVDPTDRRACAQSGRGRRRLHRALLRDDGQSRRGGAHHLPGGDRLGRGVQRYRGAHRRRRVRGAFARGFGRKVRPQDLPRAAGRAGRAVDARDRQRAREARLRHYGLHHRRVLHLLYTIRSTRRWVRSPPS